MPACGRELRPGVAVHGTVFTRALGFPLIHPMATEARHTGAGRIVGRVHASALNPSQHILLEATSPNGPSDSEAADRGLLLAKCPKKLDR